ncbi:replication initiator [Trebonia sp.]|uniref:replication initiator n=1 Tax=Trebonia sp. TaxID=2767075 RepID=UPI0026270A94|nr:replication initiator [Trebonia sp.]
MTGSGAAAPIAPEPEHGPGPVAAADDVITWADFRAWERQVKSSGACSHPVRLHGRIDAIDLATGETAPVYDTSAEPGGVLHVACGNRRESRCPSCSAVYKRDARQLVRAGLTGGKGVPESVATHPCVFATLTAPSFGPVHSRRVRGKTVLPCRPRRDASKRACREHGRDISCNVRHSPDDPRLGRPMCPDCYDYEAAVLFNFHAGELWRRFTTYLPRHLARLAGVTGKRLRAELRIRYVKVAEYQARGVVHFHAVIRLDANTPDGFAPPPARYTPALLCDAIALAARAVRLDVPGSGPRIRLGFGRELDTRPIWCQDFAATGNPLDATAVANYIAKYVTKAVDVPGLPDTRIRHASEIGALRCPAHHKRMVATAWDLGARTSVGDPRLRLWAHQLGYGGHPLTKSRRYSVTFGYIRGERVTARQLERHPDGERDPWGRPLDETEVLVLATWSYAGTGYTLRTPAAELALVSADMARGR